MLEQIVVVFGFFALSVAVAQITCFPSFDNVILVPSILASIVGVQLLLVVVQYLNSTIVLSSVADNTTVLFWLIHTLSASGLNVIVGEVIST